MPGRGAVGCQPFRLTLDRAGPVLHPSRAGYGCGAGGRLHAAAGRGTAVVRHPVDTRCAESVGMRHVTRREDPR